MSVQLGGLSESRPVHGTVIGTRGSSLKNAFVTTASATPADASKIQQALLQPMRVTRLPLSLPSGTVVPLKSQKEVSRSCVRACAQHAIKMSLRSCFGFLSRGILGSHTVRAGAPGAGKVQKVQVEGTQGKIADGLETANPVVLTPPKEKTLGEKDGKLHLDRTRKAETFEESRTVDGKCFKMKTCVQNTREETQVSVQARRVLLTTEMKKTPEGAKKELLKAQIEACEAQLNTLDRESDAVHSMYCRTVLQDEISTRAVGETPNTVIKELQYGESESRRTLQFGSMGDQRNTKTSLKQLSLVVEGKKEKEGLSAEQKELESKLTGAKIRIGHQREDATTIKTRLKKVFARIHEIDVATKELEENKGKLSETRVGVLQSIKEKLLSQDVIGFSENQKKLTIEVLSSIEGKDPVAALKSLEELKKTLNNPELTRLRNKLAVLNHVLDELEHPERVLAQRREIVQSQMLFAVHAHVKMAVAEGKEIEDSIDIAHLALLHPDKDSVDKESGLTHDERYLIEDMEQIYKEFDGKTILFHNEGEGPAFIDLGGNIHLPRPPPPQEDASSPVLIPDKTTLHTHFGNVIVQTTKKVKEASTKKIEELNRGLIQEIKLKTTTKIEFLRKEINKVEESLCALPTPLADVEKLKQQDKALYVQLYRLEKSQTLVAATEERMRKGEVSYDSASSLIEAQKLLGWRVSTGCYSDKDRGGYTGRKVLLEEEIHAKEAEAKYHEMRKKCPVQVQTLKQQARALSGEIGGSLRHDSCEMQLVRWTTKIQQHTLKVWPGISPFKTPFHALLHGIKIFFDKKAAD
jgi:hypothetical protein